MKIGVPKEIKTLEFRVGMTPAITHSILCESKKLTGTGATTLPTKIHRSKPGSASQSSSTKPTGLLDEARYCNKKNEA